MRTSCVRARATAFGRSFRRALTDQLNLLKFSNGLFEFRARFFKLCLKISD